jgi:DNA-binding SARP family transcriptional activator
VLRIRLLGELEVDVDGAPLAPPSSRRAWALLGWLALHPGPHPRGDVAARFWPDVLDASARASLRSAVWALRRPLEAAGAADRLRATRDHVGLVADAELWVDRADFDAFVAQGRAEDAVALCRGPLLHGLEDEWVYEARDEHARRLGEALGALADAALERGDVDRAVHWTRRRAALDPLDEEVQRALMALLADGGDRSGALAVYGRLRDRLRDQLGVAPAAPTRALADRLRRAPAEAEPSRTAATTRVPADAVALVGRAGELGALRAAWSAAREGAGSLVLLTGEAGIGKTRLAGELLDAAGADGARSAACGAAELGGAVPFGLWAELLSELAGELAPPPARAAWPEEVARLSPSLPQRLGRAATAPRPAGAPELERARLFEAVVELVDHAVADRPLALLFEDVHLADAASLALAAHVARRIASSPVLLVLTRRPFPRRDEVDALVHGLAARRVRTTEVELAPLDHRAMTALVLAVARLSAPEVDRVVAMADGNPLLGIETARAADQGQAGSPPGLRAAVRAATAALDADARRVAELAAVAGGGLHAAELQVLADPATVARAMDCGLLAGARGRLSFRHDILRQAVYDDLPEPRRAERHAELAAAATARPAAERAGHLRLAGRDDLALEQLVRAANDAWAVTALTEAAGFLREAAELAPDDAAVHLRLAETEAWRGRREAADESFADAIVRCDRRDHDALARAWIRRARWCRGSLCDPRASGEAARHALELLGGRDDVEPERLAEALALLAWPEAVGGELAEARRLMERIEELEPLAADDLLRHDVALAHAHVLLCGGDLGQALEVFLEAAAEARRARRADLAYAAWINAACAAAATGDLRRALVLADRCLLDVRGIGPLEVQALAARALLLVRLGRPGDARTAAALQRDIAAAVGDPSLQAVAEHDGGLVAFAAGDWDEAVRRLDAALDARAPVSRPVALLTRAEALTRLGRLDHARRDVRATALEPLTPADFPAALVPRLTRVQGLIAAAAGDPVLARRRLEEAAAGWRALGAGVDGAIEGWQATLVDFGRVPVAGLVEPDRELDRVRADLAALDAVPIA